MMADTDAVDHRVAVVTGAGSGIGKAVALGLVGLGFQVASLGRSMDKLQALAAEAPVGRILPIKADVTNPVEVSQAFERVAQTFGRLDLLFNNAGTGTKAGPLEELAPDSWLVVLQTNVSGVLYCTQAAFRIMKAQSPQGGRIINNGSLASTAPRPHSIAYSASKHAVTGLTKATALEGRKYNIACGQINIGNAATAMTEQMSVGVLQPDFQIRSEPTLNLRHVVDALLYMAQLPLEANVHEMTVMATTMPYVGRG